jgi:hypothetical protein
VRLGGPVEIEVDDHVLRVVDGPKYPVAAHARLLASDGVAFESRFPGFKVADGMFNLQGTQEDLLDGCVRTQSMCLARMHDKVHNRKS